MTTEITSQTTEESTRTYVDRVVSTVGRVFRDATTLEVRTFTTTNMSAATADGPETLRHAGTLRAFSRLPLDGDVEICAPVRQDGTVDEELWAVHKDLVELAQNQRTRMITETLNLTASLYRRIVPRR